uniref:rRNA-processing protein n=1 Tax=Candidozyma auris TaxID=498019 RepID=A0A0L0NTC9_CANAR
MSATADKPLKEIPKQYINPLAEKAPTEGPRVNGKNFKIKKDAFRVRSLGVRKLNTWELREKKKLEEEQYKARLRELKQEKEDEKNLKIAEIKRRRELKEEKERYEKMAEKMHRKKVERMRKKEKRNKALRER